MPKIKGWNKINDTRWIHERTATEVQIEKGEDMKIVKGNLEHSGIPNYFVLAKRGLQRKLIDHADTKKKATMIAIKHMRKNPKG